MFEGFAPRFAVEAVFLVLLGIGAGYADLRTWVIVALVAGGWVVVSLIELAVWRGQTRPVAAYVPARAVDEHRPRETMDDEGRAAAADGYPLRAGAGDATSEEVEAYTRILGGFEGGSSVEAAAPPSLPPS